MKHIWHRIILRTQGIPWLLLLTVYGLIAIGLINLYSATGAPLAPGRFHDQLMWVFLGSLSLIFWGVILDIRTIERLSVLGYCVVCILLAAVDLTGKSAKGAERWLVFGPVRIQPSEFAKFIIILIIARSFTMTKWVGSTPRFSLLQLWRQGAFVLLPFFLIYLQPDLGTAGLVLLIATAQIGFVRVDWRSILSVALIGLTAGLSAWNFYLYDYQKLRILNFLNPMRDPRGTGYHSIQSMIAVGSGGLWGRGFQQGTQAQLNFLPERHTDFIFSVWAEEHGFVGCLVIFLLYSFLVVQVFQIAHRSKEIFSTLVAAGVGAFLIFHFVINVSMVLGLFPVVGVPLSLVSYGGSHMLTTLSCLGLLVAVERRRAFVPN